MSETKIPSEVAVKWAGIVEKIADKYGASIQKMINEAIENIPLTLKREVELDKNNEELKNKFIADIAAIIDKAIAEHERSK